MSTFRRNICAALIIASGLGIAERAEAGPVYLAIGDSLTFGIDPSTPSAMAPSYGDQGFVRPFADFLASGNGGVRPDVKNLAISGETSKSFFTGNPPAGWTNRAPELNLNYPDATTSQNSLMLSTISGIHAAGNTVGTVSFLIGSNDIFALVQTPAFQGASEIAQKTMIAATLAGVEAHYLTVLSELKFLAPEAKVILPGYYNPFPAGTSEHDFYQGVLSAFNPMVEADAKKFGATYVDLQTPFTGRELELTNIATGNVHPNQAGYAVIETAIAHAVPEPSSLIAMGLVAVVAAGHRRRLSKLGNREAV